jgi:hypothetical protein
LRRHTIMCGPVPVRTWEASSAKMTSRTQCREGFRVQTANGLVQRVADPLTVPVAGSPATADSPGFGRLPRAATAVRPAAGRGGARSRPPRAGSVRRACAGCGRHGRWPSGADNEGRGDLAVGAATGEEGQDLHLSPARHQAPTIAARCCPLP